MHVAVLGAGVVGVTTAWYLRAAGHTVTLIDRQPGVALETSFANGAQISAGHAEPWAQPGAIGKLLRWLPREDAPLLFRLRLDAAQWRWGLRFLAECRPQRFHHNLRQILALGVYSRNCLRTLRAVTGLHYQGQSLGILNIYEDARDFARAREIAAIVREWGYLRMPITPDEALLHEPALVHRRRFLAGATWTPPDETGDAFLFTQGLANRCRSAGVEMRLGWLISGLEVQAGDLRAVLLRPMEAAGAAERLACDACVVALGSYSVDLLRPLGIRLAVYPAKGYSATLPLRCAQDSPRSSVTDETSKVVLTRLGERLRIAGTAEFNGYSRTLDPVRCAALLARGRLLFPKAADYDRAEFWTGLRPATPSNRPLIGATRIIGLYLNTGHGTLGWTEACGSAHALSLLIDGRQPDLAFDFLAGH
jgi:D-amino-acid dehydrogenase